MNGIRVSQVGAPEVLEYGELPDPTPGPGQLVVEVAAAGVNFIDIYHRKGGYPLGLPFTPGLEAGGVVAEIGPEVSGWAVGDRVAYPSVLGAYAERTAVPADRVVRVPTGVEMRVATAAMLQGMTAHYLSHDTFRLESGDRCLVHAGAGGVGHLLIQMAKIRGATVFTTVSTEAKAMVAEAAGADVVIRYTEEDFVDGVRERLGDEKLDVVYESVGKDTFARSLDLLRPRGMMVLFGQSSGPVDPVDPQILNQKGSLFLTRPTLGDYIATTAELEARASDIFDWIGAGKLDVRIGHEFTLADAAEAHRALAGRKTTGKVLLIP